jgi:hypothetical protein
VKERLDGGPRRPGLLEAAREIVDHFLVAHVAAIEESHHFGQAHAGKVSPCHALEIGAAPLHAQDPDRAPEQVALRELDRRVPAAPDGE